MKVSNKKVLLIGLLLALILIAYFRFDDNKKKVSALDPSMVEKLELMRGHIVDTQLKLTEIIPANKFESESSKLVVYYHSYDCTNCVNKLMEIIIEIRSLSSTPKIYVISNELENRETLKNHLIAVPFFVDSVGKFPKKIHNSYSPVILYLDKNNIVNELLHVTTPLYIEGQKRFSKALNISPLTTNNL
jgi:hypothetical protein